ncbi:hypothetical protein JCM19992_03060 [Thermostilla marina]
MPSDAHRRLAVGAAVCVVSLAVFTCQAVAAEKGYLLDGFAYADAESAAQTWTPSGNTPPPAILEGGTSGVRIPLPFGSQDIPRTIHDRDVSFDLSLPAEFVLELETDAPAAIGYVSLYFRSGDGWYAGSGKIASSGRNTLVFPKVDFRVEGTPAGWNRIDGIRLSFWKGKPEDGEVVLRRLIARYHDVAVLVPSAAHEGKPEYRTAIDVSDRVCRLLDELGIGFDRLDETSFDANAAAARRIVLVPYDPFLEAEHVATLAAAAKQGTKLFLSYQLPRPLAAVLGIGATTYRPREREGQFARIAVDTRKLPGAPPVVLQTSWNITEAQAASADCEVVARWTDREGRDTGAALLVSPRGAFFSHVLLGGDLPSKRRLLAAVLGKLDPALWREIFQGRLAQVERVGTCRDFNELTSWIDAQPRPQSAQAAAIIARAQEALAQAKAVAAAAGADARRWTEAVEALDRVHALAVEAYLAAQQSNTVEGRAIWNHSGTGAYPGDWDRTARELAAAGFNMVLPNMLWGGSAHYPSDLLPRSSTFTEHGDQIAQCVEACRRYGIEVHVWKVNFNLSTAPASFVQQMRSAGRTQVNYRGEDVDWLCPSDPRNFELERDSMLEVARRYDVDGLHFDYIRYPGSQSCYCDGCRKRFEADLGRPVAHWPDDCRTGELADEYQDWRCAQINRLVEAVSSEARRIRPGIKISAAVFGRYPDCRASVGQDWPVWIEKGWLDFVCPMDYTEDDAEFRALVRDQRDRIADRVPLYPGIGAWRLGSADRVVGQIAVARELGTQGFVIFNLDPDTPQQLFEALRIGPCRERARPPHRTKE